uniref:DNA internalization-related competence protein ComEC/Rec2 n=1 Tax=Acetatifactor sp. TaxID=1872090 RepID=UPI0040571DB1
MRRPLFAVCLCLVTIAAIRLWFFTSSASGGSFLLSAEEEEQLNTINGEVVTVTGRVYQKDTQSIIIKSLHAVVLRQEIPFENKFICTVEDEVLLETLHIGSDITVQGTLRCFSHATNPGEFDMASYYNSLGICGKLTNITVQNMEDEYSVLQETLWNLRMYFKERLRRVFPGKEASVLTAMLLGDKTELDSQIKTLYKENGIIHILSISGLHITIIGMSIYQMMRRAGIPVWLAAICGGGILCLYGVMTGLSVSACRAIGMYLIRMLAEVVGRTYDMLTALGILAVLLIWHNPANLSHAGFLLSFGSVLGIGWFYPALLSKEKGMGVQRYEAKKWKRILKKLWKEQRKKLFESITASASITLFTLPVQLWFYYEVPVYSVFLNLLVLPFMSLIMVTGLVVMILPGSGMLGTITCLILQGYEWLCECFEKLPYHTWNPGKPQTWQVVVYYLLLLLCVVWRRVVDFQKNKNAARTACTFRLWEKCQKVKAVCTVAILTAAVIVLTSKIQAGTTVTFLDVGQGDCMVMETVSGEVFLFDCGSTGRNQVGQYVLLPFLKYNGIRHIDAVFVSHPDVDHCSGVEELLVYGEEEGIIVERLVLPAIDKEMREEMTSLQQGAEAAGIKVSYISAGDSFTTENASFLCLHPPRGYANQDSNACSQCFYVELYEEPSKCANEDETDAACSLLFTGDVEGEGEELLWQELKNYDIRDVTVLKVAHHGSRYSTSEEILELLKPKLSVISCGRNNSYGHPHEETLDRLEAVDSEVFVTSEYGAITLEIKEKIVVRSWIKPDCE